MNKFFASLALVLILASCSNAPETETGEIRTLQLLKKAFDSSNKPKRFMDARNLINREQIDAANIPVLFVELASGQNGTLTPYPGQGVGQTWLGADDNRGKRCLKSFKRDGRRLDGIFIIYASLVQYKQKTENYNRSLTICGNNKISKRVFSCDIKPAVEIL